MVILAIAPFVKQAESQRLLSERPMTLTGVWGVFSCTTSASADTEIGRRVTGCYGRFTDRSCCLAIMAKSAFWSGFNESRMRCTAGVPTPTNFGKSKTFPRIHFHRPQHPVSRLAHRHPLSADELSYRSVEIIR